MKIIERLKQELISKFQQLQIEHPSCSWLEAAVYMNNPTDLKGASNGNGE